MNLNFALLKERLLQKYPDLRARNFLPEATYCHPVLYEPGMNLLPGRIYVTDNMPLSPSSIPENVLILFPGEMSPWKNLEDQAFACITLKGHDSTVHVLNLLLDIFDEYQNWENTLSQSLLSGSSISQLLTRAYPMLGCPLCLLSRGFSMIAFVGQDILPPEYQIFNNSEKTIEYINSMKQDEFYNEALNFEEPYIFPEQLTGIRSWNINIQQFGRTTHRLMMLEYPRPFTEGDAYLLDILASYIQYLLYHTSEMQFTGENSLHSIFSSILTDSSADYIEISQHLSAMGWYHTHSYLSMVLRTTYMDQQNLTTNAICSYIEELLPASCCIPYKKDIVAFFNLTLLKMDREKVSEKLACFIRDSYFNAGYSRTMTGHMNLRRQYVQAFLALNVGSRYHPHIWIHQFNQIALPYLLERSTSQLPGYMVCAENLLRLKEIDDTQGTNYMQTLRTYLENHLNAVQSAKDLFIHRSTFLYRLDKIKKIMETELDDSDELLYLLLSFRLLDLEEERQE